MQSIRLNFAQNCFRVRRRSFTRRHSLPGASRNAHIAVSKLIRAEIIPQSPLLKKSQRSTLNEREEGSEKPATHVVLMWLALKQVADLCICSCLQLCLTWRLNSYSGHGQGIWDVSWNNCQSIACVLPARGTEYRDPFQKPFFGFIEGLKSKSYICF